MWGVARKGGILQTRRYSINLSVKVALSKLQTRKPIECGSLSGNPMYRHALKKHLTSRGIHQDKRKVLFKKSLASGKKVLRATLEDCDIESVLRRSNSIGLKRIRTDTEATVSSQEQLPTSGTIVTSESQIGELTVPQPCTLVKRPVKSRRPKQKKDFFKIRYDPDTQACSSNVLDFRTNLTEKVNSISREMNRPIELNILQWQGRGLSSTWTLKREAREKDPKQESSTRPEDDTNNRALQMRKWYQRLYKKLSKKGVDMTEEEKDAVWQQMMSSKSERSQMTDNWYRISSNLASRNWYYDSKIEELHNVSSVIPHFEYSYPHHNPGKVYPKKAKIEKPGTKKKKKK